MSNNSKKSKPEYTPEYYLETIILKLDRIEADLVTIKLATIENSRQIRQLGERLEAV